MKKEGFERISYYTYPDYVGYGYLITRIGSDLCPEFGVFECKEYPVVKNSNGARMVDYSKVNKSLKKTFEFLWEAKSWAKDNAREF